MLGQVTFWPFVTVCVMEKLDSLIQIC